MRKKLFEKFLEKAQIKFGDKFDYSKVDYVDGKTPVTIICPKHGEFEVKPTQFLQSKHGCKKCSVEISHSLSRRTTEQFVEKAKEVWGNRFNYDKIDYKGSDEKVIVTCPIHGDFLTRPADFLRKHGCPKCKGDKIVEFNKLTKTSNTKEFVEKGELLFPNLFEYSKVNYIRNNVKVIIYSKLCNEYFEITPQNFLKGDIRKKYLGLNLEDTTLNQETFLERAKLIRPEFDYSKTIYINFRSKVEVICPIHGSFWIYPVDLLYNNGGCPICSISHGEKVILNTLEELKIDFNREYKININEHIRRIDFVIRINKKYIFIEYNGRQHYESIEYFGGQKKFELQVERDNQVREYCKQNNIILLEYKYNLPFYELRLQIRKDIKEIIENSNDSES